MSKNITAEASTVTENEVKTSNIVTQTTSTKSLRQEIKVIPVDQLFLDPEVSNIFPIEEENLEHVKNSIKEQGFLISEPIKVRERDGKYLIEDGHTRVRAVVECGIKEVFAVVKEFTNQNEFIEDAITAQTGRRNVRPTGFFKAIEKLSVIEGARAKARQEHKGGLASEEAKGSANSIISTKLGISKSMVERIKKLQRDAPEWVLNDVFDEKITITTAYNQLIASEKQTDNISSAESVQSQSVDEVEDVIEPNSDSETISNIESGLESSESKNIPDSESSGNLEVKSDSDKKESGDVQWSEEEAIALIKDLIAELKTHPNYKKLQRKYTKSYPAFTNLLK